MRSLDEARAALVAVLDGLEANPITPEEVERTRNQALSGFEQQMNNTQSVAVQLSSWAAIGDWRLMFLDRDRVREVTVADVQRTALAYLKSSNRTVGLFMPGEPDRAEIPERPDVTAMLQGYTGDEARAEGEAFDPTPANIDARTSRVELPNGIKLVMLPKETRGDAVNAVIRLNYGDENSLKGIGRYAGLMIQMLMRGSRGHTRQEIEDELARLQSQLNIGGGSGLLLANLQSTRPNLAATIELAAEILREPAFPDAELDTLKDLSLASIESGRSEPQSVVGRAYSRHWARNYAPDDVRYVATIDEEIAFISAATTAKLRELHSGFIGATQAEIVVIGDFDPNEVRELIAEKFGDWRSPKPFSDVLNRYADLATDPKTEVFDTPDKENAFFLAGMPLEMRDSHADYPALVLGNYILGQGAASRLFGRIRGREGLSYGVGSGFNASPRSDGASFTVNAIAAPENAEKVEASFRDELATVLRDGYTEEELAAAKQSFAQARQVARTQDGGLAGTLGLWEHVGRTMAWTAEFEARVQALTVADVRDAMRRHLDVEKMTFMRGGDFAAAPGAAVAVRRSLLRDPAHEAIASPASTCRSVDDCLVDQRLELVARPHVARLVLEHHQRDELLVAVDDEVCRCRARPAERARRRQIAGCHGIDDDAHTEPIAFALCERELHLARQVVRCHEIDGLGAQDAHAVELTAIRKHLRKARVVLHGTRQARAAERQLLVARLLGKVRRHEAAAFGRTVSHGKTAG